MYDIIELNALLLPDLRELAKAIEIEDYKGLKKQDLIYKILDQQMNIPEDKLPKLKDAGKKVAKKAKEEPSVVEAPVETPKEEAPKVEKVKPKAKEVPAKETVAPPAMPKDEKPAVGKREDRGDKPRVEKREGGLDLKSKRPRKDREDEIEATAPEAADSPTATGLRPRRFAPGVRLALRGLAGPAGPPSSLATPR